MCGPVWNSFRSGAPFVTVLSTVEDLNAARRTIKNVMETKRAEFGDCFPQTQYHFLALKI